ncbi:MAG: CoA ester lyase [Gammaproteobacteria bacterium]|nr:CoA ester lyase [Gammaproteobacteria bacterium]
MAHLPTIGIKGPRRSLHFVPGGNEHMFAKALDLPADTLILDLEDSVPPEKKSAAREAVSEWLCHADFGQKECLVRINPQDSVWGREDLKTVLIHGTDGLVLPKVIKFAEVDEVAQAVTAMEKENNLPEGCTSLILIGTESPAAVFHLHEMAGHERVDAITWGAEDLSAMLGARAIRNQAGKYLEVFSFVRSSCLLAAAAAEILPIDAVYADYTDCRGLKQECHDAADMGFTGKMTIHPDQIEIVNTAFTPSDSAVAEAHALIAAFASAQAEGRHAFSFDGRMVDAPHLKSARHIISLAARISEQDDKP